MAGPTREEIFAKAAEKLRYDFGELSVIPHKGVKGNEAASLVKKFLNDHLPKRFEAGSGFIIDPRDAISRQTDVVIYDALNCPVYRASDEGGIYPADQVAAVVEVKSSLDGEKLLDAAENIAAAKQLAKTMSPPPTAGTPESTFTPMDRQTIGCVFAFQSALTVEKIAEHYRALLVEKGLGPHIDVIVLLDRALLSLSGKFPGGVWTPIFWGGWGGPAGEGSHVAVATHWVETATLDVFLRLLLRHLTKFRGAVDPPGLGIPKKKITLTYFKSHTEETDAAKQAAVLRGYFEEVQKDFDSIRAKEEGT